MFGGGFVRVMWRFDEADLNYAGAAAESRDSHPGNYPLFSA